MTKSRIPRKDVELFERFAALAGIDAPLAAKLRERRDARVEPGPALRGSMAREAS